MTQDEINKVVAAATGEDLCEIRTRGFSMIDPKEAYFDPEPDDLPAMMLDWDSRDDDSECSMAEISQFI